MTAQRQIWLETDEQKDIVDCVEELERQLKRLPEQTTAWKWAVMAMSHALSGALVGYLSGTAQVGALDNRTRKKNASLPKRLERRDQVSRGAIAVASRIAAQGAVGCRK